MAKRERESGVLLQSIHARHVHVHKNGIERSGRIIFHSGKRSDTVIHNLDNVAPGFEQTADNLLVHQIVLGNQQGQYRQGCHFLRCTLVRHVTFGQREFEPEDTPFANAAFNADLPTHQFHKILADRQSKTATTVLSRCGAFCLTELTEQPVELVFWDTDSRV